MANPNSSLGDIEDDLTTIESELNGGSHRGRAFFNSVNSMLGSLRARLSERPVLADDEDRSKALSERLQTAELAHTNRVPLNLLRNSQTMEQRDRDRESLMRTVTQGRKDADADEAGEEAGDHSGRRRSSLLRSSSLVASRRRLDDMETSNLTLHASVIGMALLSPSVETLEDTSDRPVSASVVETESGFETPLLFSKASRASFLNLSTRNISGSVVLVETPDLSEDVPECAVYSWGASHSLHDDETERTPEDSLVKKSERLGRVADSISVACGPNHSAVATQQGELFVCGDNTSGAVAPYQKDQTMIVRPTLVEALGQTMVRQVSCGWDHTAAVSSTGVVLTWGSNEKGQLGHFVSSTSDARTTFCYPKAMTLGPGTFAASVTCGDQFTMVMTTRMSMMICGKPEMASHGKALASQLPVLVGLPIASVAAGKDHAVILTAFGTVYTWGSNASGCCGRPFPKSLSSPVPIVMPSAGKVETSLGSVSTPKLVHDGTTVHIDDDVDVVHAACGDDHTVLVTRSGRLFVCGSNAAGQLPINSTDGKPHVVVDHVQAVHHPDGSKKFRSAEAGQTTTLLLDDVGDVWQVQSGNMNQVLTGKGILAIAAGGKQCIALSHGGGAHRQFNVSSEVSSPDDIAESLETLVKKIAEEAPAEDKSVSEGGEELVKRLEQLLKHPSVLNSLFLDPSELDHLCTEIYSTEDVALRKAVAAAVEKSILEGLESLQTNDARMKYPSSVRCLLHYIRFFDFKEDDSVSFDPLGTCISALCEALLSLPFEGFKNLLAWLSIYTSDLFVNMLVNPLLSQLDKALRVDVDENGVQHSKAARRSAPLIVGVLKWLHAASERKNFAIPESFYCKAIGDMPLETLYEDLHVQKETGHVPHGLLLSESPFLIPPSKKRDLLQIESQVNMVRTAMQDATPNEGEVTVSIEPFFVVEIDRENVLEETFAVIKDAKPSDLRRKLRIKFKGEDGIDAGGVTREFFSLVSEEVFDINSALWTRRFGDEITWFNSDCTWDNEGFDRVGVLVGLALYNGVLLDVHFPEAVYRKVLDEPLGLEDLVDKELKRGLQQLLDYEGDDVEYVFCLTFEITWMDLGKEQKVDLKPGGADIEVTNDNKEEYVLLYVKWLLVDSVRPQWDAFSSGVNRIMEGSSIRHLFTPHELELLVVGSPELDFAALQSNAEYEGGFDKDSPVVKNLWKFVKETDRETQMKFLKFTTGNCKAPIGGLGALDFKIQRAGADSPQLPTSHTCFNTLLLPDYGDDYEKVKERLGRAVLECEGFGLE